MGVVVSFGQNRERHSNAKINFGHFPPKISGPEIRVATDLYIVCPIVGSCLVGCSEVGVGIQINARGGGNKIRFYAYHIFVILS